MRIVRLAWTITLLLAFFPICRADGFDGVWRSLGYGQVLHISGESVTVYQQVAGRVLESRVEKARREGTRLHFEIVPWDYRSVFILTLAGDMLALSELDAGREIFFQRLAGLPPLASRTVEPRQNLDYLLGLFDGLYPAFEDRNVDWRAVTRRVRAKLESTLDEEGLFALCREALENIGRDGHVGITGPAGERYSPARALADPMIQGPNRKRQIDLVRSGYLQGPVKETANGKILFGRLPGGVGYINVLAVEGMAEQPSIEANRAAVSAALDELYQEFREAPGLIAGKDSRSGFA